MNTITRSGLALAILAGAGLSGAAHAGNLGVKETTSTGTFLSSPSFLYTYDITPAFDTTLLTFSFSDPNVSAVSASGPLSTILATSSGNFVDFSATGGVLTGGSTEEVIFSSPDAPGGFVNIASDGLGGTGGIQAIGPAAVPEASTTVSFGLLLMLGLGGAVVAARKKKAQASA